jgi:hypothetical protein
MHQMVGEQIAVTMLYITFLNTYPMALSQDIAKHFCVKGSVILK